MTTAFATVDDLEQRWRTLTDDEKTRAEALLGDASTMMMVAMAGAGVDWEDAEDPLASALVLVCCSIVKRAMLADVDMPATTSYSQSADGFSESFSYSNPNGDLYLTKAERKLLGVTGSRAYSVRPHIRDAEGNEVDGW